MVNAISGCISGSKRKKFATENFHDMQIAHHMEKVLQTWTKLYATKQRTNKKLSPQKISLNIPLKNIKKRKFTKNEESETSCNKFLSTKIQEKKYMVLFSNKIK